MRKFMAVLALSSVSLGALMLMSHPPKVHATQAPQYKCIFTSTSNTNWLGGSYHPNGACGYWYAIGTNQTITLWPGNICSGYLITDVDNSVCGQSLQIGVTHDEESDDGGVTWHRIPPGTDTPVIMPNGLEAEFDIDIVGVMDHGHVRIQCQGGTGGQ